jgi:Protein of unknown function (DUF1573)
MLSLSKAGHQRRVDLTRGMTLQLRAPGPLMLLMACYLPGLLGCSGPPGGDSRSSGPRSGAEQSTTTMPIRLESSTDFGCLTSDTGVAWRLVRVRHSSVAPIRITRWNVSCDCLTIEPPSMELAPGQSTYIKLAIDTTKEGPGFVGDLSISVDGYYGGGAGVSIYGTSIDCRTRECGTPYPPRRVAGLRSPICLRSTFREDGPRSADISTNAPCPATESRI